MEENIKYKEKTELLVKLLCNGYGNDCPNSDEYDRVRSLIEELFPQLWDKIEKWF